MNSQPDRCLTSLLLSKSSSRAAKACHRADRELGCGSQHTALPDRLRLPAAERMEIKDIDIPLDCMSCASSLQQTLDCSTLVPGSEILYVALNCHGALKDKALPHFWAVSFNRGLCRRSNCHLPCGWKLGERYAGPPLSPHPRYGYSVETSHMKSVTLHIFSHSQDLLSTEQSLRSEANIILLQLIVVIPMSWIRQLKYFQARCGAVRARNR